AERVEDGGRELGELVEEQSATVREAHLPWARRRTAADQREMRRGVMRSAERTRAEERALWIDQASDAVDRAGDDGLIRVERGQQRRDRACEQRLARSRRPDEQQAVSTSGRDLKCALRRLVPRDIREI